MEQQALINVICSVYNVDQYLEKCLDSILQQSYQHFEVILIDDGSTDASPAICDEYARKDSRIKVIHQDNHGLGHTRNVALKQITGSYIVFVDSDDFIHPDYLKLLLNTLIDNDVDIVQCGHTVIHVDGREEAGGKTLSHNTLVFDIPDYLAHLYEDDYRPSNIILCNKLYKSSLWEGVEFPCNILREDEYVGVRVYDKAVKLAIIPDSLYYYVQRASSLMNSSDADYQIKGRLDLNRIYDDRIAFFRSKGYDNLAEDTYVEKTRLIRHIVKLIKKSHKGSAGQRKLYLTAIRDDMKQNLGEYLRSKKIKRHTKFKFIRYRLGVFR